jgi:UDP-N-acetylglucosamine pyrophosphorylase
MNKDFQIIILAAGHGTRMASSLPKVMHKVGDRPMLDSVLYNAKGASDNVILVYSDQLRPYLEPYINSCQFVLQRQPLGTAHAVFCANQQIETTKEVIVIFGDNPFISSEIIQKMITHLRDTNSAVATLVFEREDPAQYGRIITDKEGNFLKIVEFKFASEEEKKITLCNSGIMAFAPEVLQKYLPECLSLAEGEVRELYLTDMVEICMRHKEKVSYLLSEDSNLVVGVNTPKELEVANGIHSKLSDD